MKLKRVYEKGFTLIEMVIALVIVGLLASLVIFSYDGSKSKAQALVALMEEYGGAMQRIKADGSCYPKKMTGLFDLGEATGAAGSFCGADLSKQWNGPYVKPANATALGSIKLGNIAPEAELSITRTESTYNGSATPTYKWYIVAYNIPSEITTQALLQCNGSDSANAGGGAASTKCSSDQTTLASTVGTSVQGSAVTALGGELHTFDLMFDETRR